MLAILEDPRILRASDLLEKQKRSLWKSSVLSAEELLAKGALSEWTGAKGSGKTTRLLRFFAEQLKDAEARPVAWISQSLEALPCALAQTGIQTQDILFLETRSPSDAHWAAHQCLRSGLFDFLVLECEFSTRTQDRQIELRRLQVEAERTRSTVILLRESPLAEGAWAIHNRNAKNHSRLTHNLRLHSSVCDRQASSPPQPPEPA
jgi:hypothetical protein